MTLRRLVLSACCLVGLAAPAGAQTAPGPGRISVVGHATIELPPDFASVQIGVATKAPTAAAAMNENNRAVERTIGIAKGLGVEAKDIGTGAVTLSQAFRTVRSSAGTEEQPDGYAAQNLVTVRLADMAKLGDFMQRAVEGGANRIDGVSFGLREPERAERMAGAAATRDAVERAKAMAEAAGAQLGPIERIASPARAERALAAPYPAMRMAAPGRTKAVPIEAGAITVAADVEVVWVLAP